MAKSMYASVKETAATYPKETALFYMGKKISYEKLMRDIDTCAYSLSGMGLKAGEAITINLPNIPSAVVLFYAVNKIGAVANVVHPLTPTAQLVEIAKFTESKLVFIMTIAYGVHSKALKSEGIKIVVCGAEDDLSLVKRIAYRHIERKRLMNLSVNAINYNCLRSKQDSCAIKKAKAFDEVLSSKVKDTSLPSVYLHSGGTTGEPKTIMLSDDNMNNLANRACDIVGCPTLKGKGMLAVLPMFHGFGLCMCIHAVLSGGATSYLLPQFNPAQTVKLLRTQNVNYMAGVPTLYKKMLDQKAFHGKHLQKLEFIFCGGDSMPLPLKVDFDKAIKDSGGKAEMLEGYGMTETIAVCAVNTYKNNKPGSVGKPLGGMRVKARDVASGEILPHSTYGELLVNADTMMVGYLKDKDATKSAIVSVDGEKWVATGDYGMVDEEGYVWFKQRIKRIIKVSGAAVFPSEIESRACEVDGVTLACAYGMLDNDGKTLIKMVLELTEGADKEKTLEKVKEHLAQNLIKWSLPRLYDVWDKLPVTMVGKVDYKKVEAKK